MAEALKHADLSACMIHAPCVDAIDDLSSCDMNGALRQAAGFGKTECVHILLDHGAEINAPGECTCIIARGLGCPHPACQHYRIYRSMLALSGRLCVYIRGKTMAIASASDTLRSEIQSVGNLPFQCGHCASHVVGLMLN